MGVVSHPFYAVSATDGSFVIEEVPPGEYVVEAWHEFFENQTQEIKVGEGALTVNFTLTVPKKK